MNPPCNVESISRKPYEDANFSIAKRNRYLGKHQIRFADQVLGGLVPDVLDDRPKGRAFARQPSA